VSRKGEDGVRGSPSRVSLIFVILGKMGEEEEEEEKVEVGVFGSGTTVTFTGDWGCFDGEERTEGEVG